MLYSRTIGSQNNSMRRSSCEQPQSTPSTSSTTRLTVLRSPLRVQPSFELVNQEYHTTGSNGHQPQLPASAARSTTSNVLSRATTGPTYYYAQQQQQAQHQATSNVQEIRSLARVNERVQIYEKKLYSSRSKEG